MRPRARTASTAIRVAPQQSWWFYEPNKKWWDKACENLDIKDVDLYGGTKHPTATALGDLLTPEQVKRGGTGSATNKALDRYFQPRRTESENVVSAIKQLQKKQPAKVVKLVDKKQKSFVTIWLYNNKAADAAGVEPTSAFCIPLFMKIFIVDDQHLINIWSTFLL